ncbi:MAG: LPS-assembly protein LptD [Thermoanaerobaculia bacterium]
MSLLRRAIVLLLIGAVPVAAQDMTEGLEPALATGESEAPSEELDAGDQGAEDPGSSADGEEDEEPPPVDRITFSLPFSDESGGGLATGTAGTLDYLRRDFVVASDAVEFNYQTLKLQAEIVSVDLESKELTAEGRVIMDEGPRRLSGERLVFDLETKQGTLYEARAFIDPDVYFEGTEIAKVGDDLYTVTDGTMTSCSEDRVPDWSFRLGQAKVRVDGFARVKNTRMRVKKMPFLYLPYMAFPTQGGRVPGFLFPNLGYSSSRGAVLGLAWFQPFGDSYDTTIYGDLYGENYTGLGAEFRYAPSAVTSGTFRGFAIDDPIENDIRWKASWRHSSNDLPLGMRGVVNYLDFSDFNFFRDFERNFNDVTIRTLYSAGFLSGNWGSHSLNVLADQRETFLNARTTVTLRQLPEVEYRLRPTRLGRLPLYLSILGSVNRFEVERGTFLQANYSRADFLPTLTLPISTVPWLSFSLAASGRSTWYEDSLSETGNQFSGESLTRTFPSATASLIGPSFSKILDRRMGRFGKFKHIIEPRWAYLRVDEFDEQNRVPLFDEVDRLVNREVFSLALVNRVLAKPADEALGGAREILSFTLSQQYSLRDEQPFERSSEGAFGKKSPISALLRFNPTDRASLEARASYSALFDRLRSASLLGGMRFGNHGLSASWVTSFDPELGTTRSHQVRLNTDLTLVRNHLRMQNQVNVNLVTGVIQQHRHILYYTSQCYGVRFEFRQLETPSRRDRDIRLGISLKNIGSFLDLNSGESERL